MTILCKNSCRDTRLAGAVLLGLLVALLPHPVVAGGQAAAQESLEQQYQRAVELFRSGKMDGACELFQQIEKAKPGYSDVRRYLNPSCDNANQMRDREENLVKEGEKLLSQRRLDEAKQKFENAKRIQLEHPKYRTQIDSFLRQIDGLSREEATYHEAVHLFNQEKYAEARDRFTQIERRGGAWAADARNYLQQLEEHEDSTFSEALRSYRSRDFSNARRLFKEVIGMSGRHKGEAEKDLKLLEDEARKQEAAARALADQKVKETGQDPKQAARQLVALARTALANRQYADARGNLKAAEVLDPANADVRSLRSQLEELAAEDPLREGLASYFQGKYEEAERYLNTYVDNHGRKLALAYFFRGAVHGSRYFLSGERDNQQKQLALTDFRTVKKEAPQFRLPKKFVSPKILALYSKAVEADAR